MYLIALNSDAKSLVKKCWILMSWGTEKWNLTGSSPLFDYGYFCLNTIIWMSIWYNECTASSPTSWIACLHSGQNAGLDAHHTDTVLPLGI